MKRLLIPASLRTSYMHLAHGVLLLGAHRDAVATRRMLETIVFWPGMAADIVHHCRSCHTYQVHSQPDKAAEFPVGSLAVFHPMQRISLDTVGPIKASGGGNQHLLVVVDHFTKYAWIFAIPDITAHTIARVLWNNVFAVFGTPTEILTDGAPSLLAAEMVQLYQLFKVEQVH